MTDENLAPAASLDDLSSSPRSSILLDIYPLHDRDKPDDPSCDESNHHDRRPVLLHDFVGSIPSLVTHYKALPRCDDGTGPLSKPILDLFGYVY
jgi:hypothetical protein